MNDNENKYHDVLVQISDLANAAVNDQEPTDETYDDHLIEQTLAEAEYGCTIKRLPERLLVKAAAIATHINPVNAPAIAFDPGEPLDPMRIAVLTAKYWGPLPRRLTVSFMENTAADLRARIISHMNAWRVGISFAWTQGIGDVRISRGQGGYWSYLGTDIRLIPRNRPTMNLEGFTMNTPESEYRRVVRHEAGHTLGFPHEHMRRELIARLDREKTYIYFQRTYGWNRQMVDQQVLTPLNDATIMKTPPDQTSIMCYQLPGSITRDGQPITGGTDINATDSRFARGIYPRLFGSATTNGQAHDHEHDHVSVEDWGESEDVALEMA